MSMIGSFSADTLSPWFALLSMDATAAVVTAALLAAYCHNVRRTITFPLLPSSALLPLHLRSPHIHSCNGISVVGRHPVGTACNTGCKCTANVGATLRSATKLERVDYAT